MRESEIDGGTAFPHSVSILSSSPTHTEQIAAAIARHLRVGDVVVLAGALGGGKTCFVRGAVRALGSDDHVTSPTFAIVQQYEGDVSIVHADCYRLRSAAELLDIGFDEVFDEGVVAFLEWGEIAVGILAVEPLFVSFVQSASPESRRIEVGAQGPGWIDRLALIATSLGALRETDDE